MRKNSFVTSPLTSSTIAIGISLGAGFTSASARILNVPADFQTIQAGIANGNNGDTVLVQPGVYHENVVFDGRAVVVGSLFLTTDDPAYIDSTIIDGSDEGCVVTFMPRNRRATLRGFTIRNGNARFGGGLYCRHESVGTMEDLVVIENSADISGGGAYCNATAMSIFRRVKFIGNSSEQTGGGIGLMASNVVMDNCEITRNSGASGAAIFASGSAIDLSHLLVANNVNNDGNYPIQIIGNLSDEPLVLDHLTIADNESQNVQTPVGMLLKADGRVMNVELTNSILNDAVEWEIELQSDNNGRAAILSLSYCDLIGNVDAVRVTDQCRLDWGAGNIARDPLFVDSENGDYHLDPDSPCVDTGDPEYARDPDGSRTEIGTFYMPRLDSSWLGGRVSDWFDRPIGGAVITGDFAVGVDFLMVTNNRGEWGGRVYFRLGALVRLQFEAQGYQRFATEFPLETGPDDQYWVSFRLHQARAIASIDSVNIFLRTGQAHQIIFEMVNSGDAAAHWQADAHAVGDPGLPAFSLRQDIPAGRVADDESLESVAFDGNRYFVAGANDNEPNMIYIFDRQGTLRGAFRQPDTSRTGFKDLEWDGELLWGCNNGFIWGFTTVGEVVHRFEDPLNPSSFIACDPGNDLLWVSGTATSLVALDYEGHVLDTTLDRQGLRIYGLSWLENDPDGADLYIQHRPDPTRSYLAKMNVETGELIEVGEIGESGFPIKGLFICNNFDKYRGSVAMAMVNRSPEQGGDGLQVYQLFPNSEWLSVAPLSGEIPTGQRRRVEISLRTMGVDSSWSFTPGAYEGTIEIATDAAEGDFEIPVSLTVTNLEVEPPAESIPTSFGIISTYPQPFNSTLSLEYALERAENVRLGLFDPSGRMVMMREIKNQAAGLHKMDLDAGELSAGVYLLRLEAGEQRSVRKIVLLK